MFTVAIRPATPADVPAILPMVAAICEFHESLSPARYDFLPDVVERYRRWLPQRAVDPRSVLLVACVDEVVRGFLVGTVEGNIPIYRTTEFGFIHDVWVEPEFRRMGLARGLVTAAVERFRAMGVAQIRLETAAGNEGARRLFGACGFEVGSVEMMRRGVV